MAVFYLVYTARRRAAVRLNERGGKGNYLMRIADNVTQLVGNTPLVRLQRLDEALGELKRALELEPDNTFGLCLRRGAVLDRCRGGGHRQP